MTAVVLFPARHNENYYENSYPRLSSKEPWVVERSPILQLQGCVDICLQLRTAVFHHQRACVGSAVRLIGGGKDFESPWWRHERVGQMFRELTLPGGQNLRSCAESYCARCISAAFMHMHGGQALHSTKSLVENLLNSILQARVEIVWEIDRTNKLNNNTIGTFLPPGYGGLKSTVPCKMKVATVRPKKKKRKKKERKKDYV